MTTTNELAQIPPEYQELFREALQRELAEAGQTQTDSDILAYLRQRRDEFKRGDYIRPDGQPGTVALDPDHLYSTALPQLAQELAGGEDAAQEKRKLLLKGGVFAFLVILFGGLLLASRHNRAAAADIPLPEETPLVVQAPDDALVTVETAVPTPAAPRGADTALQTIGGLGGSLTLGRPSALELHYAHEEVVALPIDPSQVTNKGELRYNAATMRSDNPVAVWVLGTVLNYAIGLPENLVRALQPGDQVQLHTDTGFTLAFVVTETGTHANHESSLLLSQDRAGMTLFALPAPAADAVPVAIAVYDLTAEDAQTAVYQDVGTPFHLGDSPAIQVNGIVYSDTADGLLQVVVQGSGSRDNARGPGDNARSIVAADLTLTLLAPTHQTTAVTLPITDTWETAFLLPPTLVGEPLTAVFRRLPGGESALVRLGEVPRLDARIEITDLIAAWQPETKQISLTVTLHNPGLGTVWLPADYVQIPTEGGDAYRSPILTQTQMLAGSSQSLSLTFAHPGPEAPVVVQLGEMLWEGMWP